MKEQNFIELPRFPKNKEYEECVSAFFQCTGYYIEKNIIKRTVRDVLELDIITTKYYKNYRPEKNLIEVKSGKWGHSDIFKISGWMHYLDLLKGILVVQDKIEDDLIHQNNMKKLNIDLLPIPEIDQYLEIKQIDINDFTIWRLSYWVERNLLKLLTNKKKSEKGRQCYEKIENYYFQLNSGICFVENPVDRIKKLYDLFIDYGHISANCANELNGGNFYSNKNIIPEKIFAETFYECKFNELCISTFVEHRARLAILKNAIDYIIYKKQCEGDKTSQITKFLNIGLSNLEILPKSLKNGIEEISSHKYFYLYPVFWQWFMWFFGGFILLDKIEEEYKLLSIKTGIPVEEIPNALKSYDLLFPSNNNWLRDLSKNSNIKVLNMFSVPFMGIGVNYRRLIYTETKNFDDLKLKGKHTLDDLRKWDKVTKEVLSKKFK